MALTTQQLIDFWKSVDVDGRRIEQIYVYILNGTPKSSVTLTPDESKAWDVIASDIDENPAPDGSEYEIPSDN